jgi:hypothetical protein
MNQDTQSETAHRETHIVVTCSNRKRRPIPADLCLQDVRVRGAQSRFDDWVRRVSTSRVPTVPAEELYAGEHWQTARSLAGQVTRHGGTARTWICSAGYGLIPLDSALRPYAATFAFGHVDSVGASTFAVRQWWDHHTAWQGPSPSAPRSLATLAVSSPAAVMIVVLSSTYLRACAHDLLGAAEALQRPEQLSVISAGASAAGGVQEFLLPVDAHLQTAVGGSLGALNVRLAARLLGMADNAVLDRPTLNEHVRALRQDSTRRTAPQRTPMTDEEVCQFIAERFTERSTHTALLRQLRNSGHACEQKRFAQLFAAVAGSS